MHSLCHVAKPVAAIVLCLQAFSQSVVNPSDTIVPSDLTLPARFGDRVVVDGRDMLVLSVERPPGAVVTGVLRFFRLRSGRWLRAGDFAPQVVLSPFNWFGFGPLELNGDWAAVSHGGSTQGLEDIMYMFHRQGDQWSYTGDLDMSRIVTVIGGPNNGGGGVVGALRGDKMIVMNQAYALLYELIAGQWTPIGEVHPPTIPPGDPNYRFLGRIAFDGVRLVSGLLFLDPVQGVRTNGAFQWLAAGTGYVPGPEIQFPAGSTNGSNWQISDRWLVNTFAPFPGTGYASIFERDPATDRWVYHSRIRSPQPGFNPVEGTDDFGNNPFAMLDDRVLIGAESHLAPNGTVSQLSGAAFVYEFDDVSGSWNCTRWLSTSYAQQAGGTASFRIGRGVGLFHGGAVVSDPIAITGGQRTGAVHVYYDEIADLGCAGSDPAPGASRELSVFGCNGAEDPSLGFQGVIEPGAPYVVLASRTGSPVSVPGLGATPLCVSGPRMLLGTVGVAGPDGAFETGADGGVAPLEGLLPGDSLHFQVLYRSQDHPGRLAATESRVVTFR